MEEQLTTIFEMIGINKNESKVYLELLKNNNSTALDLSKKANIHRSNTYDCLRKLINKGFVSEIVEQKKRLFCALPPEKIKDYIKQQEQEVNTILPYLNNISQEEYSENNVTIIKGVFLVRETLYDLFKVGKTINVFGDSIKSVDNLGEGFLKEFHNDRINKKISMRHIYDNTSVDKIKYLNKLKYTETKFLSKKYCSNSSTFLCGDFVYLIVFNPGVSGILINNKEISETYHKYYELLWNKAKNLT